MVILVGIGAVLLVVLAVYHLWPDSDASPTIGSRTSSGSSDEGPSGAGGDSGKTGGSSPRGSGTARELPYMELFAISQQPKPIDMPVFKKALKSTKWENRHVAVVGMGRLKEKGDPPALLDVLLDKQERPEVRAAAAEALGAMRHIDAGPALMDAMSDDSDLVRAAAGAAMSNLTGLKVEFSARGSFQQRQHAIDIYRRAWPRFYPELVKMKARGG